MFVPRKRVDGLHQVIQSGGWYWNAHNAAPLYLPRGIRLVPSLSLFGLGWSGAIWPQKCKIACASDYFCDWYSSSVVFAPALETGVTVAVPTSFERLSCLTGRHFKTMQRKYIVRTCLGHSCKVVPPIQRSSAYSWKLREENILWILMTSLSSP